MTTTTTKSEILALLKRNGGHSVSELAAALKLAPITVRQHLTRLERDGLLAAERRPGVGGRPHYVFRLTAKAHAAAFPRRSDRLVELLIREFTLIDEQQLRGLQAGERAALVLRGLAQRLAEEYAPLLRGWPLEERVVFVSEVMHAEGGFAEWTKTDEGYEIRDYNCLFHRVLNGNGDTDVCEWHRTFLSEAMGAEVRVVPCPDPDRQCCRFLIFQQAPAAQISAAPLGAQSKAS